MLSLISAISQGQMCSFNLKQSSIIVFKVKGFACTAVHVDDKV